MMKVKLFGVQDVNFTNANGETINGTNIFVGFSDENVEGLRTEKFFIKDSVPFPAENVKINSTLELSFNHKGKVEAIYSAQ
jgi:hypothetical protein